jgi:endonuclease YncB( thermonuclease family)
MVRLFSGLILTALLLHAAPGYADSSGKAFVIDGDSLRINGQMIRLYGIDAPEGRQSCLRDNTPYPCGEEAAALLRKLTARKTVRCAEKDRDAHGRSVAECFVGDRSLNAELVKQGWALAYRRYSRTYVALEDAARRQKRGLWAGEFQKPWDYRRDHPMRQR